MLNYIRQMPNVYKRNTRSYKKSIKRNRKGYKRRGRRGNPFKHRKTVVAGLGFPSKYICKLKYCDNLELDATTGAVSVYRFSANGLFDPNITGTGHQPLYFDQLMALYDHYTVLGSKIKVITGFQSSGNTNPFTAVTIMCNDNTTAPSTSMSGITEQSQVARTTILDPFNAKVLSKTYSAKRVFGGNVLSNSRLLGDSTSNPSEDWYFDVKYQTLSGATAGKIFLYVELEYLACFTELKDIAQS